uniref:Uncharacterized protein n=1 Tax=Lepeophtheirus salmonis TaxID=72036 RepID=A0A0K2T3M8_LEPSM
MYTRLIEIQGYTITRLRLMFDFRHASNIDVIVDERLCVWSKSVFSTQQSVRYIKSNI